MAVLIGMSADVKGKNTTIEGDELTIGRSADNTISINNATVSGHHCKIIREGERFTLKDLGSTNGTRLNTKDVKEAGLKPKDIIQVGSVEFMFNADGVLAEADEPSFAETEVIVGQGATVAPESFSSISPFGAKRRENAGMWMTIIIIVGVLALAGVGYLVYSLFTLK